MIKEVAFVPYTPDSKLKVRLQKGDDDLCETFRNLRIRFIEKTGSKIAIDVGHSNAWSN